MKFETETRKELNSLIDRIVKNIDIALDGNPDKLKDDLPKIKEELKKIEKDIQVQSN